MPTDVWGSFAIPAEQRMKWQIGPLDLWAQGLPLEWRLVHAEADDRLRDLATVEGPSHDLSPPEGSTEQRYASDADESSLELHPLVADRPVVVRPKPGLVLVSGATVAFFVSTPAWVGVRAGRGRELCELPCTRPSDTWFGANTREGELCYAGRTHARLSLDEVPRRPGRVLTEVRFHNQGVDPLTIDRVQIPLPHLTLYRDASGTLWTNTVTVTRSADRPEADVQVAAAPPLATDDPVQVAPPRAGGTPSLVVRALGALLA